MSSARVLRGLVLGALGGFVGWLIVEPIPALTSDEQRVVSMTAVCILGAIIGGCIGLALGISEGIAAGTKSKFLRASGLGALFGVAGGLVGLYLGQTLYSTLGGQYGPPTSVYEFFRQIMARSLGWALIGTGVGLSVGIPTQSSRKTWHGFIGGTLGGFLGGFSFQTLAESHLPFTGENLRMIGFTTIGAAIGFFVSLVDEAFKQAWVRVLVGRNEGKEHILDKAVNLIGRDELAEVPLFGDPAVARQHATIERVGGRRVLRDAGSPAGTLLNGQRVAEAVLRDGDRIQIGGMTMIFYEKATASHLRRPVDAPRSPALRPPPTSADVCPFCGERKDPVTGACACTVAGATPGEAGRGNWPGAAAPGDAGFGGWPGVASPDGMPAEQPLFPFAPAAASAGPRLVVVSGPHAGQSFPLAAIGTTTIGRDPSRDVALSADPTTSRQHATITRVNGGYVLRDEGSANGTFLNGMRVTEQGLSPGDAIRIGANQLQFEL
jgi:pSer/pThr/pTyr-binding forkhead associated (FHA) protein